MSIYLPIAEMTFSLPLLAALGLAIGVISGMFGIGGGFLLTPLLIFLGVPPGIAVGTGASLVTATSVSGALVNGGAAMSTSPWVSTSSPVASLAR